MNNPIYEPKGRAAEYSPLALNVYSTCSHKCIYCYCANMFGRINNKDFFVDVCEAKEGIVARTEKQLQKQVPDKQVLVSFVGDLFCDSTDRNGTGIAVLKLLKNYGVKTALLTKGTDKAIRHIPLLAQFGDNIQVGTSLTCFSPTKSKHYERGASLPESRFAFLTAAKSAGIKTFASFEPILEVGETFKCIDKTLNDGSVDVYKIGRANNYANKPDTKRVNDMIDYVLPLLRTAGKGVYIKEDTRKDYEDDETRKLQFTADESTAERWFL